MPTVSIGYRQLYDAIGCSIANQKTTHITFPFGQYLQVEIYMGNKPKCGVWTEMGHEDYIIPGEQTVMGHYTYHRDATESPYPRKFFTEIVISQEEEVTDELFEAFYRNDQTAGQELLNRTKAHTDDYYMVADLLSGIVGLRFHPQFIGKLLNENFVVFHNEQQIVENAGSSVRLLEAIQLSETGINIIHQMFPEIGKAEIKTLKKESRVLSWLTRAWKERDIVSQFNALFISLEMILSGIQGELPEDQRKQIEILQNLIDTHAGEDKEALKVLLDKLVKSRRPSLIDRFNIFAKQSKLSGWEKDIKAFKKFNSIRNSLIHRGDSNVQVYVSVGEAEMHALEDLTERYVNYYLFHDTNVYQRSYLSRIQP